MAGAIPVQFDSPPIVLGGFVAGPGTPAWFRFTRPANATAYAVGQALADSTTLPTPGGFVFKGMARSLGGAGRVSNMIVTASAGTVYSGELWLFNQPVLAIADAATFSVAAAALQSSLIGTIAFNTNDSAGTPSVSFSGGLSIVYQCAAGYDALFGLIKILNTPTPGNAEVLSFALGAQN